MTTKVDELSRKKREIAKLARALIRAKHAAALDEELALVLPRIEDEFDQAVLAGKAYELDVLALLDAAAPTSASVKQKAKKPPAAARAKVKGAGA